jgi:phospholipid transport system substrate-binding protein
VRTRGRKPFFFEKKSQETFDPSGFGPCRLASTQFRKSFLLLFFKKEVLSFFLLFVFAGSALGQSDVSAPIAALDDGLMHAERISGQPFLARYNALAPVVDHAFNLPQILQTIIGLKWPGVSPADQKKLLAVFRAYTICNYVANFNSDSGDKIKVLPETRTVGADRVVETEIVPSSGEAIRIDYVMRQSAGSWQSVDVLEDRSISQVAVQRSDFRALMDQGADALIASLQAKVDKLSGSTITP